MERKWLSLKAGVYERLKRYKEMYGNRSFSATLEIILDVYEDKPDDWPEEYKKESKK